MRAYTELLVKSCHRRGAFAMGGMAAFIPNRRDPEVTEAALAMVREDKTREAGDGFDGTWVAHPDLVPTATEEFDAVLGERPNQIERQRPEVTVNAEQLLSVPETPGEISEAGIRQDVSVGIRYLAAWLNGTGAAAIDNLMEDVATAEISRSQIWQWVHHGRVDTEHVLTIVREEAEATPNQPHLGEATKTFEHVALTDDFVEFLTLPAYELL
jgi:malate synthase